MISTKFKITNLTCAACIKLSTMALKVIPGVSDIKIDLASGQAELLSDKTVDWEQIYSALQAVGKDASQI